MTISTSSQYGLAIHTTTPQLGIAIDNFAGDSRHHIWDLGRDLSSCLHQYLQQILQPQTWQDLQFIAVAKGPGGFTGTRIGVVAARTLGQQLNIPVYGISTLAAVAHSALNDIEADSLVAVQMNTRREQLFVAVYRISQKGIWYDYLADTTTNEAQWQQTLTQLEQPWQLVKVKDEIAHTVDSILALAMIRDRQGLKSHWSDVMPFYGQHPV